MPTSDVMMIDTTCIGPVTSMNSITGFSANAYGTMNAAIASFVDWSAVFIGFDCAMAAPA